MARALSDLGEVTRVQVPFYEDLTGELRTRLAEIGRVASRLVAQARPDVILCQGTSAIPGLVTDKPIAFWHDTTWFGMKRLSPRAFRAKYPVQAEWDETVLRKARLAIFASEWAAAGAREAYGVREDRFAVVPFGANLESDWSPAEAVCAVNRRGSIAPCELAFIGVDWRRKGLPAGVPNSRVATRARRRRQAARHRRRPGSARELAAFPSTRRCTAFYAEMIRITSASSRACSATAAFSSIRPRSSLSASASRKPTRSGCP